MRPAHSTLMLTMTPSSRASSAPTVQWGLEGEVAFSGQFAQRATRAWLFTRLQVLRQRRLIPQFAHRHGGVQCITFRNVQLLAGQLLIKTGHAVGVPAAEARLQRQVPPR